MTEGEFLSNLYVEFVCTTEEEYKAVGRFIDSAAMWSSNGSSYQVRTKLQRKIKSMYSERVNETEIKPFVEAFNKVNDFIKYYYKGNRSRAVLESIDLLFLFKGEKEK